MKAIKIIVPVVILAAATILIGYSVMVHRLPSVTSISDKEKEETIMEKVSFVNSKSGLRMAGIIYKPTGFDEGKKYPAIIVAGPMLSVKEQAQSIYAKRLSEAGYVTIVFDYTYFGESEGEPRQLELPDNKATDIHSVVDYLMTLDYVDADRIGGVGICGSGSYMPYAAISDERIRAVASVVPATTMDQFIYTPLEQVRKDKEAYEKGEADPTYIDLMPRAFAEGAAYYYNDKRGARENWSNLAVSWSEEGFVNFHPTQEIGKLKAPYMVITAENAWSRSGAEEMYQNATSEKELHVVEKAGHFDMYDLDPYVTENLEHLTTFFEKHI